MIYGPWIENDGYVESIVRFEVGLPPIAKLRAVKTSDGNWEAVVRETSSGRMISSSTIDAATHKPHTLDSAKAQALYLIRYYFSLRRDEKNDPI